MLLQVIGTCGITQGMRAALEIRKYRISWRLVSQVMSEGLDPRLQCWEPVYGSSLDLRRHPMQSEPAGRLLQTAIATFAAWGDCLPQLKQIPSKPPLWQVCRSQQRSAGHKCDRKTGIRAKTQ